MHVARENDKVGELKEQVRKGHRKNTQNIWKKRPRKQNHINGIQNKTEDPAGYI